jgi:hypothetical protein
MPSPSRSALTARLHPRLPRMTHLLGRWQQRLPRMEKTRKLLYSPTKKQNYQSKFAACKEKSRLAKNAVTDAISTLQMTTTDVSRMKHDCATWSTATITQCNLLDSLGWSMNLSCIAGQTRNHDYTIPHASSHDRVHVSSGFDPPTHRRRTIIAVATTGGFSYAAGN